MATTYTVCGHTHRRTHNYDHPTDTSTYRFEEYNPFNDDVVRAGCGIAQGEFLHKANYYAGLGSLHSRGRTTAS